MIRRFIIQATLFCAAAFAGPALAATDVNLASPAELQAVKGIGPGLAGKMVQARQTATFKDWADLVDRVAGVGPGNAARFSQAGLTVAGAAYAHQPAGAKVKPAGAQAKTAAAPTQPAVGAERQRTSKADNKTKGKTNGKADLKPAA